MSLPTNFLWGVANSSFQVEGSPAPSDWQQFCHQPGNIIDASNADHAADFWNRYSEDFQWAKKLGAKAFRLSLAWERIEPEEGRFDLNVLARYRRMISELKSLGIEPIVTLQHFVLPLWIHEKGGFLSSGFERYFLRYAQVVLKEIPGVQYWITFNEPLVVAHAGFSAGIWPPKIKNKPRLAMKAARRMAKAHNHCVKKARLEDPEIKWSIAHHWRPFEAQRKWNPFDQILTYFIHRSFNFRFLQSCRDHLDFVGINYYGRMKVSWRFQAPFIFLTEGEGPKTDLEWEIFPSGLRRTLKSVWRKWKKPIMITENGLADEKDSLRPQFIEDHVREMKNAIGDGVQVIGYLHWSLTDNFEWAFGLKPRFGLIEINYQTQERIPRASYWAYQQMICQHDRQWSES